VNLYDIPYLPAGVKLVTQQLIDEKTGITFPVNRTASMMIEEIDGRKTAAEIIDKIAEKFPVDRNVIERDVTALFNKLSKQHLLNIEAGHKAPAAKVVSLFFRQYQPGFRHRYEEDFTSFFFLFLFLFSIVFRKVGVFFLLFLSLSLGSYIFFQFDISLTIAMYFSVVYIGLLSSFALHETCHAYFFRRRSGTSTTAGFIASDWMSVKFVRPAADKHGNSLWLVTLLGPLIPGITGVFGIIATNTLITEQAMMYALNSFFAVFLLQLIYLTPFFGDGKVLLKQLLFNKGVA
jgi:hypothetical protein